MKKEGNELQLVLMFFLLVLSLPAVFALTNFEQYQAVQLFTNCDSEEECKAVAASPLRLYCPSSQMSSVAEENCVDIVGGESECSLILTYPQLGGCIFYTYEVTAGAGDSDCAGIVAPRGISIDQRAKSLFQRSEELETKATEFIAATDEQWELIKDSVDSTVGEDVAYTAGSVLGTAAAGCGIGAPFGGFIGCGVGAIIGGVVGFIGGIIGAAGANDVDAVVAARFAENYFKDGKGLICGNDNLWIQCDEEHRNKLYWISWDQTNANGHFYRVPTLGYRCEQVSLGWAWIFDESLQDLDIDGYTPQQGDCKDVPAPLEEEERCPSLSESDYQGKTQEELRALMSTTCASGVYSSCSYCINPGAPEICGDDLNNDCRGTGASFDEDLNYLLGATPDSCDKFQEGCEAKGDYVLNDDGVNIDTEGNPLEGDASPIPMPYGNIQGEQFSWIDTPEGGACCGYDGLNDLGTFESDAKTRICLSNDKELVGLPLTDGQDINSEEGLNWEYSGCLGEWCWVPTNKN